MSVLSDGTPMTNGEVFALLRRRRDERSARLLPAFGLPCPAGTGAGAGPGGQPQGAGGMAQGSALFGPPPALLPTANGANANAYANSGAGALFATPGAAHLSVLLLEVRVLRYLGARAAVSGADVRQVYGPTSLYSRAAKVRCMLPQRPGTTAHVRAVDAQLAQLACNGNTVERNAAEKVARILRGAATKTKSPTSTSTIAKAMAVGGGGTQLPRQSDSMRMFAQPSTPLAVFFVSDESAAHGMREWNASDVMRIVMARPRSSLDIHRVLDGLDEEGDEAAAEVLAGLEEEILQVFATEGESA